MLKTFIAKLGGAKELSQAITRIAPEGITARAVYQWPYDGTIPHKWRPFVVRVAQDRGVSLPKELKPIAAVNVPKQAAQ